MTNWNWKNLVWIALPLALASGCASNSEHSSGMAVIPSGAAPPPTSSMPGSRVYSGDTSNIGQYSPPPGAPASDWSIAEEVRSALSADSKLRRDPVAVVVNNGVVTLHGRVHDEAQRARIKGAVAALPGVTQVNDQLEVRNILSTIPGASSSY